MGMTVAELEAYANAALEANSAIRHGDAIPLIRPEPGSPRKK
jgi:hypothetical protein